MEFQVADAKQRSASEIPGSGSDVRRDESGRTGLDQLFVQRVGCPPTLLGRQPPGDCPASNNNFRPPRLQPTKHPGQ
jgi:hypothetical protein